MTLQFPTLKQYLLRTTQVIAVMLLLCGVFQCREKSNGDSEEHQMARELVQEWNRMALELERYTPGYRPPITSRMFAYLGMAAYESSLPDLPEYVSLEWYCKGYKAHLFPEKDYWLPAGLNAAYAESLRFFFPEAPVELKKGIDQLEEKWSQKGKTTPDVLQRSITFGRETAHAVLNWSVTDSYGHQGYLYNYDRNYQPPKGAGKWKPGVGHPMPALLPYWGKIRRFATWADSINVLPPIGYDSIPGSSYHTEALEVFTISQNLSKESHWIAEFWSDDLEGFTLTPAGRWIMIANQAVEKSDVPFVVVLETYLMIGWALNDAAVTCWVGKYEYNVQRPEDFINANIHPGWKPLHDSPSFPAYPSGHSAFGAAVAEVLTNQLGENFTITDRTHIKRQEFAGKPRTYKSFKAMALENAASRLYLGVHFRMDCTEGLRIGKKVGEQILSIRLRKDELAVK
jgi:membrane-associated phospholipid phosphatase